MATRTRKASAGTSRRRASEPAGGRLNRDFADEEYREPGEGYNGEQPTKGLYTCELFGINDHTKQGEDEPSSIRWGFRLVDGSVNKHGDDVSGWPDFIYTNENTAWREQQILVATGVIKPGGKVNLPYDAIIKKAKPCTVRVGLERYIPEDGEGDPEWRGRMQAFLPPKADSAKKSRRRKDADEPVEDVFDEEETDADEDEEETPPPPRSRSRRKAAPEPEPEDEDESEDEDDEDEEPYDADELAAELEDLSLAALKKRARDEFGVKIARGMDTEAIIDAVLETLDEDEEDEEDEEEPPPPPKRASGGRRPAKTANATSARRAKRGSNEPPF